MAHHLPTNHDPVVTGKSSVHAYQYAGEVEAELVLKWLNNPARNADDCMVSKLIRDEKLRFDGKLTNVQFVENANRYCIAFSVFLMPIITETREDWHLGLKETDRLPDGRHPEEYAAFIVCVMKLKELGVLTRLRQCENCGLWFFAKFDHSVYHDRNCAYAAQARDPQRKEARRRHMRKLRAERRARKSRKPRKGGK